MMTEETRASTERNEAPMCFGDAHRVRMLVPVDCSEFSEAILDAAACTALRLDADVHLLAVVPASDRGTALRGPTRYPSYLSEGWPYAGSPEALMVETRDQALEAARQVAGDQLARIARQFAGLPIRTQVVTGGSVATAVIDYARDCHIDLIAMATHGRRPLAQALLGSVAAEVVHSGVAPCLLMKPAEA